MTAEVPGIEQTFLVLETEDGVPYTKEYFRLDIGDMTPRTLLGDQWHLAGEHTPDDVKFDPDKPVFRVPIGNLTRWVLQEKQTYWEDPGRAADHESKAREVMELILAEPLNDRFSAAVFWRGDAGGYIYPRMPEGHSDQGAPVYLFLPYGAVGVRELRDWYGQALTKSVKGVVREQTKDLRKELGKAVEKLKKALADREKIRERMLPFLQKFQMGPLVFDICDEFVMHPSVRKRRWGWEHAEKEWVIPKPGMAQTKRAKDLRRDWETQLIKPCASVMSSRFSETNIDIAALEVVYQLRLSGAAYLRMLDEWDELHPGTQAELEGTIKDAFRLALKSEKARKKLLEGEVAALVNAAQDNVTVDPAELLGDDPSTAELRDAVKRYPSVMYAPKDTPFGKKSAEKFNNLKSAYDNARIGVEILGLATPYVASEVRKLAGGGSEGQLAAVASVWRYVVGTTNMTESGAEGVTRLLKELRSIRDKPDIIHAKWRLFDHDGPMSHAHAMGETFFKVGSVMTAIMMLHYAAWDEGNKKTPVENKLKKMKASADVLKSFADLVPEDMSAGRLLEFATNAEGKVLPVINPVALMGLIADALALATSTVGYWNSRNKQLQQTKSAAFREMCFDAVGFGVSAAGMILGAEFILIGLGLYTVKAVLANLDWFAAEIPGTAFKHKPGPHVFLEKMLEEMDDDDFDAMLDEMMQHGSERLRKGYSKLGEKLNALIMENQEMLWDIGGHPDANLTNAARKFVARHWELPLASAEAIVRPSREAPIFLDRESEDV